MALARDEKVTSCKIPAWNSSGVAGYRAQILFGVLEAMASIVPGIVRSPQAITNCVGSEDYRNMGSDAVQDMATGHLK